MAQGQVMKAAAGDVLRGDGVIRAPGAHFPVEHHDLPPARLPGHGKAPEQRPALRAMEGAAPDPEPQLRHVHRLRGRGGKNMYRFRQAQPGIGTAGAVPVVVPRGEHAI